jgi:hypothetical protein
MYFPYYSYTPIAHMGMLCYEIENAIRNQHFYGSSVQLRQKMITMAALQNFSTLLRQVSMPLASEIADYLETKVPTPIIPDELIKQLAAFFKVKGLDETTAAGYAQQIVNLITTYFFY